MPLNVRKFCTSISFLFVFSAAAAAQVTPSAADVMRERVAKAKAYIVVKNYNAAIYELENIRRESSDATVHGVINVLLMNSYLEQGDYKRAQDFLKDVSSPQKLAKFNGAASYFTVAGQVVRGAKNQLERYKSLGLSVSDRSLPVEAATDVQKMRETLEIVVAQSKVLGADKKQTADAMALIEEATNARTGLARDDYDARRWRDEVADAREQLANSRSVILNASGEPTTEAPKPVAANPSAGTPNTDANAAPTQSSPVFQPVATSVNTSPNQAPAAGNVSPPTTAPPAGQPERKIAEPVKTVAESAVSSSSTPPANRPSENPKPEANVNQIAVSAPPANAANGAKNNAPLAVGSLVDYATQKANPVYPPAARTMRTSGVVRVELMVDENGQVAEVQKTSGPSLLQRAATDAVKKWKFKPFVRDGEPVKATGFVSFNFSL